MDHARIRLGPLQRQHSCLLWLWGSQWHSHIVQCQHHPDALRCAIEWLWVAAGALTRQRRAVRAWQLEHNHGGARHARAERSCGWRPCAPASRARRWLNTARRRDVRECSASQLRKPRRHGKLHPHSCRARGDSRSHLQSVWSGILPSASAGSVASDGASRRPQRDGSAA